VRKSDEDVFKTKKGFSDENDQNAFKVGLMVIAWKMMKNCSK
jgi:hypothetical protein